MSNPIHPYAVYTVKEAAELLKVEPVTIQRYIRSGKLEATQFGKTYRISGQAVLNLLSFEHSSVELVQDRARQVENANYIKSKAFLMGHPKGASYIKFIDSTAQLLLACINPDIPALDEDQKTLKYAGSRALNTTMVAYRDCLSGYYQNSLSTQRDLIETQFLMDYFRTHPDKIAEWREADYKTRRDKFSPGILRKLLDKRDNFTEKKRDERYKMFCEYASHMTYQGFKLLANEKNLVEVGPFYDEEKLLNALHELALNCGFAVTNLCACLKAKDTKTAVLALKHIKEMDNLFNWQITKNEKYEKAMAEIDRLLKQISPQR